MIPLTSDRYCPTCGRVTVHRRRLVPLDEIEPAKRNSQVIIDDKAILPLECQEHYAGEGRPA